MNKSKKETDMLKIDIIICLKIKKMKKEHMVKTDIITYPVNNYKNIKNIKKIIKKYTVQKKNQELQNSKKKQGNSDKNAILTLPKT